ncbi:MAG: tetratricopeptide repeat protein [Candidatus Acidiferrales bacterium]
MAEPREFSSLSVIVLAFLLVTPAVAQVSETATIAGTVRDEHGLPLAGANVVLRSLNPPFRREVQTDQEGRFSASGLRATQYHLLLLRQGEILWSFPVTLAPGQATLRVDIDLKSLREEAESRAQLDPELERRLAEEREQTEGIYRLHGHLNRAMRLLNDRQAEQAVDAYRDALEEEPDNGTIFGLLGSALAELRRDAEAKTAIERALELEPGEAAHHNNLAALLARDGKPDEALTHFRRAVQLDPERAASYHFNHGALLLNLGRNEEALAALQQAARLEPTLAVAQFFLAVGMLRQAEARSARPLAERPSERAEIIGVFQRYLQLAPDGPFAVQAQEYLERLGSSPPPMLLPPVPLPEELP